MRAKHGMKTGCIRPKHGMTGQNTVWQDKTRYENGLHQAETRYDKTKHGMTIENIQMKHCITDMTCMTCMIKNICKKIEKPKRTKVQQVKKSELKTYLTYWLAGGEALVFPPRTPYMTYPMFSMTIFSRKSSLFVLILISSHCHWQAVD